MTALPPRAAGEPLASQDFAHALRRAAERAQAELRRALDAAGLQDLPVSGWSLLRLARSRGPLPASDAAALLGLSLAAVSQTAAALRRAGWLEAGADARDARLRLLRPGPRALAAAAGLEDFDRRLAAALQQAPGAADLPRGLAALEAAFDAETLAARIARAPAPGA